MSNNRWRRVATILLVLCLAGGCTTHGNWNFVRQRPNEKVTTDVIVRTEPTGAEVSINGTLLGEAPVKVPVMYIEEVKVYQRRVLVPVPDVEQRELRSWLSNEFDFTAFKTGYKEGRAHVTLRGEEEREITIKLEPKKR
jgi:hypothetical protein